MPKYACIQLQLISAVRMRVCLHVHARSPGSDKRIHMLGLAVIVACACEVNNRAECVQ